MADCVTRAFDLADKYRMPAVVLADGLLGQMMEPVAFDDAEIVMSDASNKPWAANGHGNKRKHNIINSLYLQAPELEQTIRDRYQRYAEIEKNETKAVADYCDDAEIVVVAYGSTARLAKSAVDEARKQGIKAGVVRPVTLYPFPVNELNAAVKNAKKVLVVEMSMGQMIDDVKLAINCSKPVEFFGRTGGVIPAPAEILAKIKEMGGNN